MLYLTKKQLFLIDHGSYPMETLVDFGGHTDNQLYKYLRKHRMVSPQVLDNIIEAMASDDPKRGRTVMLDGGATIMRINTDLCLGPVDIHVTLAHEIFHVAEFVLRRCGLKLCTKSDEAYAYQIDYITSQIYNKLYKTDTTPTKSKSK